MKLLKHTETVLSVTCLSVLIFTFTFTPKNGDYFETLLNILW